MDIIYDSPSVVLVIDCVLIVQFDKMGHIISAALLLLYL